MPINGRWTRSDIPDLTGKTMIVTGANSGLGYETTRALTRNGAHVIMACRSMDKAEEAATDIRREQPNASLEIMELDLANLESVQAFADAFVQKHSQLDVLCNNAGVMALPYQTTADGFEMQFGTNHLGHFALTGHLLEVLLNAPGARIVTVSSNYHNQGEIDFDDLNGEHNYGKWAAYSQSKLANLLFAFELQRRFDATDADAISVGAHPGYAATNLQLAGPRQEDSTVGLLVSKVANAVLAQDAEMGALPIVYAATAGDVNGCDYIGPGGFMEMRGHPEKVKASEDAYDAQMARRLWSISEEMTNVRYTALADR